MNMFLKTNMEEVQTFFSIRSQIQLLEGLKTVSTVVLSLVADAPAQCLMMNMMQSNGNFGCSCCLAAGESCIIGESGHSRIYMYNLEDNSVNGYEQPRLTIQHYCMQSKELKIFITAENPTLNQCME